MPMPDHDGGETPHQPGIRRDVLSQHDFAGALDGRQFLMGIEYRAAETREMFGTRGDAFAFQSFQKRPRPAYHLVSSPAPTALTQSVVRARVEQLKVEHRSEINVDAELVQPATGGSSKILGLLDVALFLHVGNRWRFPNDVAEAIDVVMFLVDGHEWTIGKLRAQRPTERAQFGGGVDIPPKQDDAAGLYRLQ